MLYAKDPDTSVDSFSREVRPKPQLFKRWSHQLNCRWLKENTVDWLRRHVAVVDPSGTWLTRWDEQFEGLGIQHLRSPMSVHPDPSSSYALEMFATHRKRGTEVHEMKMMERDMDFRGPFWLPGTHLFKDFCRTVVMRYKLEDNVTKGKAVDVQPIKDSYGKYSHSVVTLGDGRQLSAKRVVIAVGSTNIPRVPSFAEPWLQLDTAPPASILPSTQSQPQPPAGRIAHAWQLSAAIAAAEQQELCGSSQQTKCQASSPAPPLLPCSSAAALDAAPRYGDIQCWCGAEPTAIASTKLPPCTPPPTPGSDLRMEEEAEEDILNNGTEAASFWTTSAIVPPLLCKAGDRVVIIGGGLTAAQLAMVAHAGAVAVGPLCIW
eukprot:gene1830-33248_t